MPEDATTPIVVNPNPVPAQVNTFLRDLALFAAAVPTVNAIIGKRDMLGLINWLTSNEAAPIVSMVVAAAITAWRQRHAWRIKAKMVTLARDASVGVVKGEG